MAATSRIFFIIDEFLIRPFIALSGSFFKKGYRGGNFFEQIDFFSEKPLLHARQNILMGIESSIGLYE